MRLLIFNPENDLALAAADPHYTPPASARQLAHDLSALPQSWAEAGDWWGAAESVSTVEAARLAAATQVLPWGWSPLLRRQLSEAGVSESILPSAQQLQDYRAWASRQTAVTLLERLRTLWPAPFRSGALVGQSAWCTHEVEVLCAIADFGGSAMLKAPWSGSGRGVHPVQGLPLTLKTRDWLLRTLRLQGGIEVEPLYPKVQDLAMEFWSENGLVRYEGLSLFQTTAGGVYDGNLVATEAEKLQRLGQLVPLPLFHDVCHHLTQLLCEAGIPAWYTGPVGVDMMVVQQSIVPHSPLQLHPLVEINLRMTMGWVALQLERRLHEGETAMFSIQQQDGHYQALFDSYVADNPL